MQSCIDRDSAGTRTIKVGKVYVEVSDLLEHLLLGKPLNGITRVILQSLSGLVNAYGANAVRLLAYDSLSKIMREKPAVLLAALYRKPSGRSLFAEHPLGAALIVQFWAKATPRTNDTLFHAGNWWWRPRALQAFAQMKAQSGAKAIFFIHDLIPIVRPEFVAPDHVERFKTGFAEVANHADLLITSSKAAQNGIKKHLTATGLPQTRVTQVRLAHEFQVMPELGFHPLHALFYAKQRHVQQRDFDKLMGNLNQSPFALMVGTIENRKNVPTVLRAWRELSTSLSGTLPKLVLLGKWGQGAEEMKALLKITNNINSRVLVLNSATDDQLEQLYKACAFTIFVSQYEGWGLPIGESLWFGKNVIILNGSVSAQENLKTAAVVNEDVDRTQASIAKALAGTSYKPVVGGHLRTINDFTEALAKAVSVSQTN